MAATENNIVNSALWAAYADALGFMSELTDRTGLRKRIHADRVSEAVEWNRVVGGRYGAYVKLPAGCYSDDTQLRLSTSRAVRGNGFFDVESFAKIELPVWLSYSLGAGVGTKAAAQNLSTSSVSWFSNFYSLKEKSYIDSGGNGAAMRVQPHVWAARSRVDPRGFLTDVVRNAVCTHGNLRGVVGAVFHAIILAKTLESGEIQKPSAWREAVQNLRLIAEIVRNDRELSSFWLPIWEQKVAASLQDEVSRVMKECNRDLELLEKATVSNDDEYRLAVESIGGLDPKFRGSGTKTALIAAALCWLCRDRPPRDVLIVAANLLESDTDTIATMVGAILGSVASDPPVGPILDRGYIENEAARLYRVSQGLESPSFCYPDLTHWSPPKNQTSSVGTVDDAIVIAGLGPVKPISEVFRGQGNDGVAWRWFQLGYGQTVIAKVRNALPKLPRTAVCGVTPADNNVAQPRTEQGSLFGNSRPRELDAKPVSVHRTLDDLTGEAIRSGFDATLIGRHILELSRENDGIERSLGYVAIISKARKARLSQRKG